MSICRCVLDLTSHGCGCVLACLRAQDNAARTLQRHSRGVAAQVISSYKTRLDTVGWLPTGLKLPDVTAPQAGFHRSLL